MPDRPANPAIPTIVVPLSFEEGWLRRLIPGLATRGHVVRCGLGRAGVRQTLPGLKPAGPVILCGIAGGLVDAAPVGAAAWVSEAVTEGATLRPDIVPAGVRLERKRQARDREWGNRWRHRPTSIATNSSLSRGLTIRCRSMTAGSDVLLDQTAIDCAQAAMTHAI